jgi:hypothetical protein
MLRVIKGQAFEYAFGKGCPELSFRLIRKLPGDIKTGRFFIEK